MAIAYSPSWHLQPESAVEAALRRPTRIAQPYKWSVRGLTTILGTLAHIIYHMSRICSPLIVWTATNTDSRYERGTKIWTRRRPECASPGLLSHSGTKVSRKKYTRKIAYASRPMHNVYSEPTCAEVYRHGQRKGAFGTQTQRGQEPSQ